MRKEDVVVSLLVGAAALIVGCSGGQQAGVSPSGNSAPVTQKGMGTATFTLSIPSASTSALGRVPAYISAGTQSISIAVNSGTPTTANLTAGSPNCSTGGSGLQCSLTVAAPIGSDTFAISLYSGTNGSGSVLSSATIAGTVAAAAANLFPITFNGTVAAISISVTNGNNLIPGGYATTLPVVVTAKDASGNIIVGPGDYANPITLSNADTSGSSVLSTATVNAPSTNVTLSYCPTAAQSAAAGCVINVNGLPVGATTIGASASGVSGANVTAGTFQYIADRFFGYGHTRTLTGTGNETITTYNNLGTPSPNPSSWNFTVTDNVTEYANATFGGVSGLRDTNQIITLSQVSPGNVPSQELDTDDYYRKDAIDATGAILYGYFTNDVIAVAAGYTGLFVNVPAGTTTFSSTYPNPAQWEDDVLPHAATTWSDNLLLIVQNFTGAEDATRQWNADGSWSFSESAPTTIQYSATATGAGTDYNGGTGITTTVSVPTAGPTGLVIPVAQQTTSPAPGPTSTYETADWYPNGGLVSQTSAQDNTFQLAFTAIPASCNVPSAIGTQAWALAWTESSLRVPLFNIFSKVTTDYYVPGGIGLVCETYTQSVTSYNYHTGGIASVTAITYSYGVPSTSALSVTRRP